GSDVCSSDLHRVEDALSAARAAVAEGIVVGGGVAYLHAEQAPNALSFSGDYAIGAGIVRDVLAEPAYWIATNAGHSGADVVARLREMSKEDRKSTRLNSSHV